MRSGLSEEQTVHVPDGLSVYSLDGQLLGQVDEFIINSAGNLTSFVVKTGSRLNPTLRVPMAWIGSTTGERIMLRVAAHEADSAASRSRRATRARRRMSALGTRVRRPASPA